MPETDWHRDLMLDLIKTLDHFYRERKRVYVSGNLLLFYEKGNKRKHVSPDVMVVRGVEKRQRPNYLPWEEKVGPQFVIELTSSTTRRVDLTTKRALYQDVLKVREYFLFDPRGDYLTPRLQGYHRSKGEYQAIPALNNRLPSRETGLHLEGAGDALRLWNPETGAWLPTPEERAEQAEQEAARLRAELEQLRRRRNGQD